VKSKEKVTDLKHEWVRILVQLIELSAEAVSVEDERRRDSIVDAMAAHVYSLAGLELTMKAIVNPPGSTLAPGVSAAINHFSERATDLAKRAGLRVRSLALPVSHGGEMPQA